MPNWVVFFTQVDYVHLSKVYSWSKASSVDLQLAFSMDYSRKIYPLFKYTEKLQPFICLFFLPTCSNCTFIHYCMAKVQSNLIQDFLETSTRPCYHKGDCCTGSILQDRPSEPNNNKLICQSPPSEGMKEFKTFFFFFFFKLCKSFHTSFIWYGAIFLEKNFDLLYFFYFYYSYFFFFNVRVKGGQA